MWKEWSKAIFRGWDHGFLTTISNFQIFYKGDILLANSVFRDNWAQNQNKMLSHLEDPTETETAHL